MVPEGRVSWSWFHHYISEIIKLGWTARTTGPGNIDLKQMPGVRTVADLATKLADVDHTSDSGWQLTQGVLGLFGNSESSECKKSFTLTGVCLKDGVLTMQMVGFEVQYTKTSNIIGEELSSTEQVRRGAVLLHECSVATTNELKEIVDFTADQPFLDAHRKELEETLREIAEKDAINIEL
ncbi:hypothetical protein BD779DRAFT_1676734 [Infundibulicybe gibba]|nr:hypothetical protein BD779DRAFT_1676734 [Infundibulicybe gibba]